MHAFCWVFFIELWLIRQRAKEVQAKCRCLGVLRSTYRVGGGYSNSRANPMNGLHTREIKILQTTSMRVDFQLRTVWDTFHNRLSQIVAVSAFKGAKPGKCCTNKIYDVALVDAVPESCREPGQSCQSAASFERRHCRPRGVLPKRRPRLQTLGLCIPQAARNFGARTPRKVLPI